MIISDMKDLTISTFFMRAKYIQSSWINLNSTIMEDWRCLMDIPKAHSETIWHLRWSFFCKNSQQPLVVNKFYEKAPSQMFDWVLRTTLNTIKIFT